MTSVGVGRFPGRSNNDARNPMLNRVRRNLNELNKPSNPEDVLFSSMKIFTNGVNKWSGELIDEDTAKSSFRVVAVDYNIESNSVKHHTDEYDITERDENPQLVVRRGWSFDIKVTMNRSYNQATDDLRIVFTMGDTPMISNGTLVNMILSKEDKPKEWGAKLKNQDQENITLEIFTPPDCYVGKWKLVVSVIKKDGSNKETEFRYSDESYIYILFNPWCPYDQVYYPDTDLLEEYVLGDFGYVFSGNSRMPRPKEWNFGQFEEDILDCAVYLLEKGHIKTKKRGDPVDVARNLSAMTNIQDDNGVLVGNWSGDYEDGTSPSQWTGSVAILKEFYKSKIPVSYGQCWVFSGVLTTLCRALGIPARSVTNYSSAHDTDGSLTIDKYTNEDGDYVGGDSVWNFHVWNDVWMARPDKKSGYGGWQAIDATPQETSQGLYQCGPEPLAAIKYGDMESSLDAKFLYSEVNADIVYWIDDKENGGQKVQRIRSNNVGKRIVTCNPNHDLIREDIVDQYKLPEGSEEEKAAKLRAYQHSSRFKDDVYNQGVQDFKFELCQEEPTKYGKDFEFQLKVENLSDQPRTLGGRLKVFSVYHTGVIGRKICVTPFNDWQLKPKTCEKIPLKIPMNVYDDKLLEYCHINTSFVCRAKETNQLCAADESFVLEKPKLIMRAVPSEVKVGEQFKVEISFTNPLDKTLTCCKLNVESPKLQKSLSQKKNNVQSCQTFMDKITLTAGKKPRTRNIVGVFNAKELFDITGSCTVKIIA